MKCAILGHGKFQALTIKTTFTFQRFIFVLKHQLLTEIVWILIAALFAIAVLALPVLNAGEFQFQWENAAVIFGFISLLRLLFFHRQSLWLRPKPMKAVVCVAMVPIFLFTILTINSVQTYVDANGFAALFAAPESDTLIQWGIYIRNEVVFFGAALLICAVILPVVLIIEVWKQVKGYS